MGNTRQGFLFEVDEGSAGRIAINGHSWIEHHGGQCVVVVRGQPITRFGAKDKQAAAYAMVTLVEIGAATQVAAAKAFGCAERTVRRQQRRLEQGGLVALGRPSGYPPQRPRLAKARIRKIEQWHGSGVAAREIARRLGITDKAVRGLLRRHGWRGAQADRQLSLPETSADPNMSGPASTASQPPAATPAGAQTASAAVDSAADPNMSGPPVSAAPEVMWSSDHDPRDRMLDRVLASQGLLDDAAPLFSPGHGIDQVGVLLAMPALVASGVLDIAREVYGSIGPAFYGLRTTMVTWLVMALLRITRVEGLKEHDPGTLGQLLGLDRAPEVKTLREKLAKLAHARRAVDFGRALARRRVASYGSAMGFLYVDGHVRVYHGKRILPKTHVARMRLSMPATTDYWVNDARGDPLLVLTTEGNRGLVAVMPAVLAEVRALIGDRRATVVFDRGGWSPKLFRRMIAAGFDVLTYRKGRFRRVAAKRFVQHERVVDGQTVRYRLADQRVLLDRRRLAMRQVTRLSDDGLHQTPIITNHEKLPAFEIAERMFGRWRQENYFKYLRTEYALDALVDYGTLAADAAREVPNPVRKKLDAELRKAEAEFVLLQSELGTEVLLNQEQLRPTMRGFKIANAHLSRKLRTALQRVITLRKRRAVVPARVPVMDVTPGEVIKLATETKLLTDLLRMVAYQAESDLVRLVAPHYARADDEVRTLVQNALSSRGDVAVTGDELQVSLEPLSSPHRSAALAVLCDHLNQTKTRYPGSHLTLHFEVKPLPQTTMAFPGPKPPQGAQTGQNPTG